MVGWLHWATEWEFDPSVWAGCAIALVGYRWLPGAARNRKAIFWVMGVVVLFVALESALDTVGDNYLFSVHMAQHLVLAMVGPPLLLLGLPEQTIDRLLAGPLGGVVRLLVNPWFAAPVYFLVIVVWHIPVLFDYCLTHQLVHILQHLSFIAAGLLFWWAVVIHREGQRWNLSPLGEVAYLTCGALPSVLVGLTLALIPRPIYLFYLHRSQLLGFSPLADQHQGGLLMFGFDNVLMVVVAGYYFWRMFPPDGISEHSGALIER